jgi:hypothetical protein
MSREKSYQSAQEFLKENYTEKANVYFDHQFSDQLISADCCLENEAKRESALYFFSTGMSMALMKDFGYIPALIQKIVQAYTADPVKQKKIKEQLQNQVINLCKQYSGHATLYSICVPKDKFQTIGYISRDYGHPAANKYTQEDLKKMQMGVSDKEEKDSEGQAIKPQVRLLAHQLTPENGVFIVPHSTLDQAQTAAIERAVNDTVDEVFFMFPQEEIQ